MCAKKKLLPLKERVAAVLIIFREVYAQAQCALHFSNPLELLVATILSAQCTDARVNLVTEKLFARYRTVKDYAAVTQEELESIIYSTGFFRSKAKAIRGTAAVLIAEHEGKVPTEMEALCKLPGVGRKTANVVLGNAFGRGEGIVVDTHVTRVTRRLGWTRGRTPEAIERDLMKLVPREEWTQFSHWVIWHGRGRCTARRPDCGHCEVAHLCPSAELFG